MAYFHYRCALRCGALRGEIGRNAMQRATVMEIAPKMFKCLSTVHRLWCLQCVSACCGVQTTLKLSNAVCCSDAPIVSLTSSGLSLSADDPLIEVENSTLTLVCRVDAYPPIDLTSVVWYKDNVVTGLS